MTADTDEQIAAIERDKAKWPGCTCPWVWGSYGRLYGISMGSGPVRKSDDRECPHHGTEAVKRWKAARR